MSSGFVKVMLIGNLGADPDVKFTASGTAVLNMRIACNERVKGKDGAYGDKTEWVAVTCFGNTAESCGKYLTKGRMVYVDGRLQTRDWTDKDGNKRYTTEVIANQVLFLGGADGGKPKPAADGPPPISSEDVPF